MRYFVRFRKPGLTWDSTLFNSRTDADSFLQRLQTAGYETESKPIFQERRQKDMGPDNPHYHWDYIDPRCYVQHVVASDVKRGIYLNISPFFQGVINELYTTVGKLSRPPVYAACIDYRYLLFACRWTGNEEVNMDEICTFLGILIIAEMMIGIFTMIEDR